jgi:hypothetical protein
MLLSGHGIRQFYLLFELVTPDANPVSILMNGCLYGELYAHKLSDKSVVSQPREIVRPGRKNERNKHRKKLYYMNYKPL